MIRSSESLREFERWYTRDRLYRMTYADALAVFEALWLHAAELNPDFPGDWKDDIGPDLEIARALNGIPPGD